MNFDVVILGGGIIGSLSAYELSKNGLKVALLEKNRFGRGASGNSAAMLELQLDAHRGDPFFTLAKASNDLFPALHKELLELTGIDFQWEVCGLLQMALNADEASALQAEVTRQKSMNLKASWLSPDELKKKHPTLRNTNFGAAFFEQDGQVQGSLFVKAALEGARKNGAVLIENAQSDFILENGKVIGVYANGDRLQAKHILISAGAWTDQILQKINLRIGVEPVRGQLLVYKTDESPFPYPVYTKTGGYITPKRDGTTLAGTTVENAGFAAHTTEEGKWDIKNLIGPLFPELLELPISGATAGLRPKSSSDLPVIGPLPDYPNVIVAAGHYRNGVLLAPVTAKLVDAMVRNTTAPIDATPFFPHPSRIHG